MPNPNDAHDSWIKDGDEGAEPVTVETPAAVEAPRVAPVVAEEVVAEVAPEINYYAGAQWGDEEYQVPADVRLPIKRGDDIEYKTIEELAKEGMLYKDYQFKTGEVSRLRKAAEDERRQIVAEQARIAEREKYILEREEEIKQAFTDPEKSIEFEEHLRMMESNPTYRRNFESGLRQRETEAENTVYRERDRADAVQDGVQMVTGWIEEVSAQYPNVDVETVVKAYGRDLEMGTAVVDRQEVVARFQREAEQYQKVASPLLQEIADLKAKTANAAVAEAHNAKTDHALNRARSPNVTPTGGRPSAPVPESQKFEKFPSSELQRVNSEWAKRR